MEIFHGVSLKTNFFFIIKEIKNERILLGKDNQDFINKSSKMLGFIVR